MPKKPIDPVRWRPPTAGPGNPSAPHDLRLYPTTGSGGEDVVVRENGEVLTGLVDGRIVAIDPDTRAEATVAHTGGRPLGLELHPDGGLVVCDAERGLLHVDGDGVVEVLAAGFDGKPFTFCNNAAVASDGTIYFSDSSTKFGLHDWAGDAIEHRPTGRLLRYSPDGSLEVVLDGLAFANGVALAPDESFVVVAQTVAYDILRVDLAGDKQGRVGRFGDPLPGFPDNVSTGRDGNLWFTLVAPRVPVLDFVLPRHPALRRLMWMLPERLQPQGEKPIQIRALSPSGELIHDIDGSHPDFGNATGVRHAGDRIWIASIQHDAIAAQAPASR
jgi:sugar lactone lactonase YvrE